MDAHACVCLWCEFGVREYSVCVLIVPASKKKRSPYMAGLDPQPSNNTLGCTWIQFYAFEGLNSWD
uniref:Uncharacterized protein n=1 Tax=Arundo donax TaxID=35708 RepID=A0A0A9HCS4_ARUDO